MGYKDSENHLLLGKYPKKLNITTHSTKPSRIGTAKYPVKDLLKSASPNSLCQHELTWFLLV